MVHSSESSPLLTIDVAHPPRPPDQVESELLDAWSRIRNSQSLRVLKVIHGHGSRGTGGSTKELVRGWFFRNRDRFLAVIDGEQYSRFDSSTQALRRDVGTFADPDLDHANPGITVVWIR